MHPILFSIGSFPVHTYGFLIAIGFLLAVQVIKNLAGKDNLPVEKILDLTFWCLVLGFVGARILFVITRWSSFMADPISIVKVWEGGLVFYGGLVFTVPLIVYYVKTHGLPVWKVADVILPGLVLNHAFGRLGCFAAGCCYGKPTDSIFGVKFDSELVERHLHGVPLHPTQLYESTALFILFVGLLWVFKRRKFDGQVTLTYAIAYPIIRSIVEVFRGDLIRGFVVEDVLSTSQFISVLVMVVAVILTVVRFSQLKKEKSPYV